jgi:tetratricopeptide (TPR) repeat protein
LLETIREFAAERLEASGDLAQTRRRHLEFFLALAEEAKSDLDVERQVPSWLERLDVDHDNFRAGLESARALGERRLELRLAAALSPFWESRSHFDEGRKRITEAVAGDPEAPISLRGDALKYSALMAHKQGDFQTARALAQSAKVGHETAGDARGVRNSLNLLGIASFGEGEYEQAKAYYEQVKSVSEQLGDDVGLRNSLHNLGLVALAQDDYQEARRRLGASLALSRKLGSERQIANGLIDLGFAALGQARHEEARALFEESLRRCSELAWKENMAYSFVGLAGVAIEGDDPKRAARILGQVDNLCEELHLELERYARVTRERNEQELEARLGASRLAACREEGRSMLLEDGVAMALANVD